MPCSGDSPGAAVGKIVVDVGLSARRRVPVEVGASGGMSEGDNVAGGGPEGRGGVACHQLQPAAAVVAKASET